MPQKNITPRIGTCDACGMKNITVVPERKEGVDLLLCENFKACNKRFKNPGEE